jgi:hypothetical protein
MLCKEAEPTGCQRRSMRCRRIPTTRQRTDEPCPVFGGLAARSPGEADCIAGSGALITGDRAAVEPVPLLAVELLSDCA